MLNQVATKFYLSEIQKKQVEKVQKVIKKNG